MSNEETLKKMFANYIKRWWTDQCWGTWDV